MRQCKYRISGKEIQQDCIGCQGFLRFCSIPYNPEVRRYVAEQFVDDVQDRLQTILPSKEEQAACRSELGKALRKCIDSESERYRIIDFQIEISNALEKAIPRNPKLYSLADELDSVIAKWIRAFQRFL